MSSTTWWSAFGRRVLRNLCIAAGLVLCATVFDGGARELPRLSGLAQLAAGQPISHNAPTITGDQRIGGTVQCGRGDWDDPDGAPYGVTYRWLRDSVEIAGQTTPSYTLGTSDISHSLRCDVMATGSQGSVTAQSASLFPPAPLAMTPPRISGDKRLRQTLACTRGTWNDDGVPAYATSRAWLRNGEVIVGQTAATYALTTLDVNKAISCRVSVGAVASSTSGSIFPTAPLNRSTPVVSGDERLGGTVSCSRGTWDDEGLTPYAVTKQWLRDGLDIIAATADDYVITATDVNHSISCRVRAEDLTDSTGSAVFPTRPTERSQPVIHGDLRLGRAVTCSRGTWDDQGRAGDYGVSYEWYRNGIFVADTAQYAITANDVNKSLRCQVVAESLATASSQTLFVPPPDNLTVPLLSGDARLGRALSCSRGTWDDTGIDPYDVAYQWFRSGVQIAGATSATLALTVDDVNRGVFCRVTAAGFTTAFSTTVSVQQPENGLVPHIEGDPRVAQDLTCTRGNWDDPPGAPYAVTYQWFRAGVAITDATSATYTVAAGDVNQSVFCRVNAAGLVNASTASATITQQPTGGTPVILIAPTISGDRRLRHAIACNRGSWNDTSAARYAVTYRWRRNGLPIAGASASSYTVAVADMGQALSCEVTAAGQTTAASGGIAPLAPESVAPPGVSGDPRLRRTLACSRGDWYDDAADRYAVSYRWLRNGTAITGATASTYELTAQDISTGIVCEVRAEGLTVANATAIGITAPRILVSPAVSGNPRLRSSLTCSRGTWDDLEADRYAVAYRWTRNSVTIDGETTTTYTLTSNDVGSHVTCVVRAEDLTNAGASVGASVGAPLNRIVPRISGRPRLRQTLSCTRGDWDDVAADRYAVTYRWLRNGVVIPAATAATYSVVADDVNRSISCRVRAEDLTDATSASLFVPVPDDVIAPAISGVPRMFRELTCSRGDWDDTAADRYAVTYVWLRNSVLIPGATAPSYAVQRDDVNKSVSCRVRAEDLTDATSSSTFVSTPTPTLRPAISGQPHLRGELSCSRGTWDDTAANRYAVSYQWYRNSVPINGATEPSYVIAVGDINRSISCAAIAEALNDSFAAGVFVRAPSSVIAPRIEGIAHPRRELTCTRGEWNDSSDRRYAVSYQWRRNGVDIPGADGADHIVRAEDVGTALSCVVQAEGAFSGQSSSVFPTWEPMRLSVVPDVDAVAPGAPGFYSVRLRNANPAPVVITTLDLTLPGGFSYRPGTITGAITADPVLTGPGALTLRWTNDFTVPEIGDAVIRVGITATSQTGDHFASARAFPAISTFTVPETGQTGRVTVEGPEPAGGACTIVGTPGPDLLTGTAGADVICGLGGEDTLRGSDGADQLWGGPGDDRLDGGAGADTLRGGDGADILDGGPDGDVMRGGGGVDTMTYAARTAPVTVTLGVSDGDDGAAAEGDTAASDIEIVRGGSAGDTLTGGLGPDELYGRAGDDRLVGGDGGGDLLDGGDGADTLVDDDGLIDRLVCGGGLDAFAADLLDRVVGCETPFSSQPVGAL